ncbi:cytochrome c [Neisseria leonii]|uniref:c-type cytochrome n=1 Tax=Neisseria leonii TaxID=2995413 RepID=UPI00237B642A|nr:cytochrome c [Neisseria sp. 3986]MDD9326472.1 cytochrome c [Neisseria sp. 3986]
MKKLMWVFILAAAPYGAADTADDIRVRRQYMQDWRSLSRQMGDLLKRSDAAFSAAEFAGLAARLNQTADAPWRHFPAGSGRGSDAAAAVWERPQAFQAAVAEFNAAAAALDRAAQSGSRTAVQTAFGQVGQSCKTCHRAFKN